MWRTHVHFPHRPRIPLRDIAIEHFSITKHYPPFVQQIFQNEGWNNIEINLKKTKKNSPVIKTQPKKQPITCYLLWCMDSTAPVFHLETSPLNTLVCTNTSNNIPNNQQIIRHKIENHKIRYTIIWSKINDQWKHSIGPPKNITYRLSCYIPVPHSTWTHHYWMPKHHRTLPTTRTERTKREEKKSHTN